MRTSSAVILTLFTSVACSTDSSTNHKDGGASNSGASANGGSANGASANGGSANGASANGGSANGASANGTIGGTKSAGTNSGGRSAGSPNAGATNGAATNSGGGSSGHAGSPDAATSSGGRSSGSGGTANGGTANGGTANAGAANDAGTPTLIDHYVTFYGWPDNDPAGNGVAYPQLHKGASGTGTYADPITFATDPTEWKPGTILYVPYLKRYVIMEDSCAECIQDWKTRKYHIDIWLESNASFGSQVLTCEDTLTRSKTSVEIDPPPDRPVDSTPLFDTKSGTCNPP
jgi:hypothetical protein